ncbi:hypothetical protein COOONC_23612 [Cooperia oncophora]
MVLVLWLVLFCFARASLAAEPTCHDSVLFHRGESILPSTDLFCVIRSNQEGPDENVPIIQSEEEWLDFVMENDALEDEDNTVDPPLPVLMTRKDGQVSEFLIPASFFDSKCTVKQGVGAFPAVAHFSKKNILTFQWLDFPSLPLVLPYLPRFRRENVYPMIFFLLSHFLDHH